MTTLAKTVALWTCLSCREIFHRTALSPELCPFCGSHAIERQGR